MELAKSYSLVSEDGVHILVGETPERERIILALSRDGKTESATLDKEMFDALFDLKYKMEVHRPVPPGASPTEKEEVF